MIGARCVAEPSDAMLNIGFDLSSTLRRPLQS
jgi:hypothetical protein